MKLYKHQLKALEETKGLNHVAYYHDMGLGKTYTGAEKMNELGAKINLVVCQKSKVNDWIEHFKNNYSEKTDFFVYNLTDIKNCQLEQFLEEVNHIIEDDLLGLTPIVGVINYDLIFRRPDLLQLKDFTLLLDESSLIQNETSKRSKFIMKMQPKNVILLSGTPIGGKYENLWSQMSLLGWPISKKMFYNHYVDYHWDDLQGFPIMIIDGYKNEERLKRKMRQYGCDFIKTDEVFDLPKQIDQTIKIPVTMEYKEFRKKHIVRLEEKTEDDEIIITELVGDTILKALLYERQLCGQYNQDKLVAFKDLLESTNDRLIVFYNFNDEWHKLGKITDALGRPSCVINGVLKNLNAYEYKSNSVTFIQYQAGAMGLNLQKANKIIYFTPPLSSELFEQSKKRIHRIGQDKPCFYYYLTCKNSIEEKIYAALAMRKDYTDKLFEGESDEF